MNKVWTVAKWEFMHFFKWKQELISKAIFLALGVIVYIVASQTNGLEDSYNIATNRVLPTLNSDPSNSNDDVFVFAQVDNIDEVVTALQSGESDLYDAVIISSDGSSPDVSLITPEKEQWHNTLIMQLTQAFETQKLMSLNLTSEQLEALTSQTIIFHDILDERIKEDIENQKDTYLAFGVLIVLFIAMFGVFGQLFVSITGEKQNRVTEQLMATMTPQVWMDGKLLGQMLLAIKTIAGTVLSMVVSLLFYTVVIQQKALALDFINWSLLPVFLIFAVAGLSICAAFMAAIASGIDDPNHSGKSGMMLVPIIPIIISFFIVDSPNTILTIFLSYFPLTSFAVMPVRMSVIELPIWEPIFSLILSVGCFVYFRIVAARIFKLGMNMYGKEPSYKDMLTVIFKTKV